MPVVKLYCEMADVFIPWIRYGGMRWIYRQWKLCNERPVGCKTGARTRTCYKAQEIIISSVAAVLSGYQRIKPQLLPLLSGILKRLNVGSKSREPSQTTRNNSCCCNSVGMYYISERALEPKIFSFLRVEHFILVMVIVSPPSRSAPLIGRLFRRTNRN